MRLLGGVVGDNVVVTNLLEQTGRDLLCLVV